VSSPAISVENLSKRYILSHQRAGGQDLRHVLQDKLGAPFRWLRGGRTEDRRQGSEDASQTTEGGANSTARLPTSGFRSPSSEQFWALKDVSFEIQPGEVVGIIGRNGAGKSTLLKILSRITEPTSGRITIEGRVASLLEVGTGFHPELTGRENIYLNGAILGMTRAEIRGKFDEIVAFAEVEKFLDTPVKHYSSGMYVRLAFAVAAHLEPEILVVDEVLAVGDAAFQKKCLGKIDSLARESSRTILLVSHTMSAILSLCSKAILLEQGSIAGDGSAGSVVEQYLHTAFDGGVDKLTASHHAINSGELWIDSITIENERGEPVSQVRFSEAFLISIQFHVRTPVYNLRFGLGVNSPDGIRIATMHHTDDGRAPMSFQSGAYHVSLKVQNPLAPGLYVLSVGVHRVLGGTTIEYVPEALHFQVSEVGLGTEIHEVHNSGFVTLSATWHSPMALA
jgi:lipopolysaccharide transport system ATP-binding protein